jgi:HD-like signal output (HDOD) protein
MQQIHDLVLSTSVVGAFSGLRPAKLHLVGFWKDCVFRGMAARAAARQLGMGDPERMFVEGLLADIGHLVMFQAVPEAANAALETARSTGRPIAEAEQSIIGCNFAEVGAALASAWHLPTGFATSIGAQLMPALGGPHATEASLLNVANQIVATDELENPDAAALDLIDPMTAARLELDTERLAAIRAQARDETPEIIALFFPGQG